MDPFESLLTALDSLWASKMRSLLTMLGVIIGVGAVIALMAIGNGFSDSITGQIQSIGTNLISVSSDRRASGGYETLTMRDVEAISDPLNAPNVAAVAASTQGSGDLRWESNSTTTSVFGVTANYFEVNNLTDIALGDFLSEIDNDTRSRVAVLGSQAAIDLFEDHFPVGETLRINGVGYEVIGVLAEKGGAQFNPDDRVYVPLTTAQARLFTNRTLKGQPSVATISIIAASEEVAELAVEEVSEILREQHSIFYSGDDDFTVFSQKELLETFSSIVGTITLFLGAIAGISLLVGGIGIMNIMLVSVTERTREIGIRKAVGARRSHILTQFLIEAMVLSLIGGGIGILLGWGLAELVGPLIDIESSIDIQTVGVATTFAATVGLLFGIYPAWRAARLQPVEALRYE